MQKLVVSGSRSITTLPEAAIKSLDKAVFNSLHINVGDAGGVDLQVQSYLKSKGYTKVTVWHSSRGLRNSLYPDTREVQGTYTDRDAAMHADSQWCLCIWDGKSRGTFTNSTRLPSTSTRVITA